MKYSCLGYLDEKKWEALPQSQQNALIDECFVYDDVLRKNGESERFRGVSRSEGHSRERLH
jgi:hypothetical protein